ncbi:MAG: adenylate/guanylate cyclase domain-containing protein [Spirochaetaceae bacterium]
MYKIKSKKQFRTKLYSVLISFIVLIFVIIFDNYSTIPEILDLKIMDLNKTLNMTSQKLHISDKTTLEKSNPLISEDIWIIGIDTNSLDKLGKWPFDRSIHGDFLNNISSIKDQENRESIVFIDIFFNENDKDQVSDKALEDGIQNNGKVFLETLLEVFPLNSKLSEDMYARYLSLSKNSGEIININGNWDKLPRYYDQNPPISRFAQNAKGYGHATLEADIDGTYRRQYLVTRVLKFVENISYEQYINKDYSPLTDFEHLEWLDNSGDKHQINNGTKNIPNGATISRYKNIFMPSITLALAAEYLETPLNKLIIYPGSHIEIPNKDGSLKIPIDEKGAMSINYMGPRSSSSKRGYQTYPVRSYSSYIDIKTGSSTLGLKDKILLVGPFSSGMADDEKNTPMGMMYGLEIHANALNTIIKENFISDASDNIKLVLIIIFTVLLVFILSRSSIVLSTIITTIMLLAYLIASNLFLHKMNFVLPVISPILIIFFNFFSILIFRLLTEGREKAHIKKTFGKYVNPSVVEQLTHSTPELGGIEKDITVFFSDIRGFTTMSEGMESSDLLKHLNEYLTAMTDVILDEDGTLDKYVGDEIMCFWGAPLEQPDHPIKACIAALKMSKRLKEINLEFPEELRIRIGMGIHTGIMSVGNVGSAGRLSYTVIGDNVNLASRLEGANKNYGTEIIISSSTYELVKDYFVTREMDEIQVKGRQQFVKIYELLDYKEKEC